MAKIQSKKNVTCLKVNAGCRLVVVTGYEINPDCISINRSPAGYDEHFYVLKNDDVIIRELEDNTFNATRIVIEKQREPVFLNIDICAYFQTPVIRKAMFGHPVISHNEKNTQLVMNDPMFSGIITHKFRPYGDITVDHLYDAPSFIFEVVQEKTYDLRVNEINFRVDFKANQFMLSSPCPLMMLKNSKLELPEDDDAIFVSRSLSRPLRLTFRSRSPERIREIENAVVEHFKEIGAEWQMNQIKRGTLVLLLPPIARVSVEG